MPRPPRPRRDLTDPEAAPNLTKHIEQHYQEIIKATDLEDLRNWALAAAQSYLNKGLSPANYRKFVTSVNNPRRISGISDLVQYLTNYMLAGAGLGVESDEIKLMACLLTDDPILDVELTEDQIRLADLVESLTNFSVVLLEQTD